MYTLLQEEKNMSQAKFAKRYSSLNVWLKTIGAISYALSFFMEYQLDYLLKEPTVSLSPIYDFCIS